MRMWASRALSFPGTLRVGWDQDTRPTCRGHRHDDVTDAARHPHRQHDDRQRRKDKPHVLHPDGKPKGGQVQQRRGAADEDMRPVREQVAAGEPFFGPEASDDPEREEWKKELRVIQSYDPEHFWTK